MLKKLSLALLAFVLLSDHAFAATSPNSIITAQTPNNGVAQFLQGTDTAGTYKTLYTAGTNGSIIKGIYATSNDGTASHLLTCQVVRSTVLYGGTAVNVPLNSGFTASVPPVNVMSAINWPGLPLDSDGNPFMYMASGDLLRCTYATALTTSTLLNVVAEASDF